ncbi:MAG: hypothetical protein ACI8SE_000625 [Bacteroidia bacterium]|jgi:hypothetical protein
MKKISFVVLAIGCLVSAAFSLKVSHIREDFHKSVRSECKLQAIIVSTTYPNDNITKGYKGLAKCTSAEFANWPSTKWKYFTEGKTLIEGAIDSDPQNPEVRYIRLMVQLNAPNLVGYSSDIDADLSLFITNIKTYNLTNSWKINFINNLIASNEIDTNYTTQLTALLNDLNT